MALGGALLLARSTSPVSWARFSGMRPPLPSFNLPAADDCTETIRGGSELHQPEGSHSPGPDCLQRCVGCPLERRRRLERFDAAFFCPPRLVNKRSKGFLNLLVECSEGIFRLGRNPAWMAG